MNRQKIVLLAAVMVLPLLWAAAAAAADFGWISDFNVRAEADPSGFRAQLGARFHIGDAQVSAVLGNVRKPADAYMVLRLGEMAHQPPDYVLERYKTNKGRGWGALAKSLGIKPGSREFHALKRGSDLYGGEGGGGKGKGKDKAKKRDKSAKKDKGKGKGRGRDKD